MGGVQIYLHYVQARELLLHTSSMTLAYYVVDIDPVAGQLSDCKVRVRVSVRIMDSYRV